MATGGTLDLRQRSRKLTSVPQTVRNVTFVIEQFVVGMGEKAKIKLWIRAN